MASARRRKDCFTSFLFVLPLLTLFLVFFAYPIIYNIVISFYDWNGISAVSYTHLWRKVHYNKRVSGRKPNRVLDPHTV